MQLLLRTWIGTILFLRIVSILVSQTNANLAIRVCSAITTFVAMAFIVMLSWTLLSRHILPYQVQDQVSFLLSLEYRNLMAARISHWREHVVRLLGSSSLEVFRRWIRGSLECVRHAMRRRTHGEGMVNEMDHITTTSVVVPSSLEAPMSHAMERDTSEHEQDTIPPLHDKKKS